MSGRGAESSRSRRPSLGALAVVWLLTALGAPLDLEAQDAEGNALHAAENLPWADLEGGVRMASLYGNPQAEGPFAFRLQVPDGFLMGPHTHPVIEHMTVLSGRFFVGLGRTVDRDAAVGYEAGSYVAVGAGVPAYMWAEGPTVVQVHGDGPMTTTFLDASEGGRR